MTITEESILIVGGRGLIGSACVSKLNLLGYKNILAPSKSELNCLNFESFSNFCKNNKVRNMIFAAGKVGGILDNNNNQINYMLENSFLALNAIKVSLDCNLNKVVLFGSSCMYPVNANQPFNENDILNGQLEKTSFGYALSKILLTEGACLSNKTMNEDTFFIPVIPNSCYGPNDNFDPKTSHVLSALIGKIINAKDNNKNFITLFGTGAPRREFIYSKDVADAVVFLMNNMKDKPISSINIGSGDEISILNLARKISELVGYKGELKFDTKIPDGINRKILDDTKLRNLGWKSSYNLEQGLRETIDWYNNNKDLI